MLRRRHLPQKETPQQTKRRQKTHETHRPGRHPPGSLPRRPQSRRIATSVIEFRHTARLALENINRAVQNEIFEFVYNGPDVQDGSISAKDLVECVSGLSRAFSIISDEYETAERYQVRVRDLEHNSAHIIFEAIAFAKATPATAGVIGTTLTASAAIALNATTNAVSGAYRVLTDLGVIIEVKKRLEGRRVARQRARFPDGQVELDTGTGLVLLTKEQYELLLAQKVDRPLAQIVSPLTPERIDDFKLLRGEEKLTTVVAAQKDYFDYTEIKEEVSKEGSEINGVLNSLNKTNLRGTFHTVDGIHVPYRYTGGNISQLLRGFTSREPIRATGRVRYGTDNIPRLVEIQSIDILQGTLPQV